MAFKLRNLENGYTYTIKEIDEIAANFWGKEVHPREFAYPGEINRGVHNPSWYDMIGRAIEDCQYMKPKFGKNPFNEWDMDKISSMIIFQGTIYSCSADEKLSFVELVKPYIELCYHLMALHIVGVCCGY